MENIKTEIIVFGQTGTFIPVPCGAVKWSTALNGCGVLEFDVIKEGALDFKEGNCVIARCDEKAFFRGYVFEKSRDKRGIIHAVCYDQLRYFKNKDCYTYYNKTAAELVKMFAEDMRLKTGVIEDTGYVIPYRIEDNTTLFDMVYEALKLTKQYTGREYVLYDDVGELCLKSSQSMRHDYYVCENNCIDLNYTSSIDRDTYTSVKLVHSDARSGIYNVYRAANEANTGRFGVLQYYSHISDDVQGAYLAEEMLKQHNRVGRFLKVKAMGDISLRAGCIVRVYLDLGDFTPDCFMQCFAVSHSISDCLHTMSLTLKGGEFVYD